MCYATLVAKLHGLEEEVVLPETIEKIERFGGKEIFDRDKVDLILVLANKKLASEIVFGIPILHLRPVEFRGVRRVERGLLEKTVLFLQSLGLYCCIGKTNIHDVKESRGKLGREFVSDRYEVVPVYFFLNSDSIRIIENGMFFADYERGILSGFPKTAIEAYCFGKHGGLIQEKELLPEIVASPAYCFAQFRLSRAHWREELKTGEEWAETIRLLAPEIYKKIIF